MLKRGSRSARRRGSDWLRRRKASVLAVLATGILAAGLLLLLSGVSGVFEGLGLSGGGDSLPAHRESSAELADWVRSRAGAAAGDADSTALASGKGAGDPGAMSWVRGFDKDGSLSPDARGKGASASDGSRGGSASGSAAGPEVAAGRMRHAKLRRVDREPGGKPSGHLTDFSGKPGSGKDVKGRFGKADPNIEEAMKQNKRGFLGMLFPSAKLVKAGDSKNDGTSGAQDGGSLQSLGMLGLLRERLFGSGKKEGAGKSSPFPPRETYEPLGAPEPGGDEPEEGGPDSPAGGGNGAQAYGIGGRIGAPGTGAGDWLAAIEDPDGCFNREVGDEASLCLAYRCSLEKNPEKTEVMQKAAKQAQIRLVKLLNTVRKELREAKKLEEQRRQELGNTQYSCEGCDGLNMCVNNAEANVVDILDSLKKTTDKTDASVGCAAELGASCAEPIGAAREKELVDTVRGSIASHIQAVISQTQKCKNSVPDLVAGGVDPKTGKVVMVINGPGIAAKGDFGGLSGDEKDQQTGVYGDLSPGWCERHPGACGAPQAAAAISDMYKDDWLGAQIAYGDKVPADILQRVMKTDRLLRDAQKNLQSSAGLLEFAEGVESAGKAYLTYEPTTEAWRRHMEKACENVSSY